MSPRGFFVRYGSHRGLDADHAAYLTHGGMLVPVDADQAPALNTPVELRIEGPRDIRFVIPGRAGHHLPGRGLMVSFEASPAREALDRLVDSADFRAAVDREPKTEVTPPEAGVYEPEPATLAAEDDDANRAVGLDGDPPTDPAFVPPAGLFEEPTPIDNQPPLAADPSPFEEGTELHPDVAQLGARASRRRRPAPTADRPPTVIRPAKGGETYHVAVLKFFLVSDFVERYPRFFTDAELDVDHPESGLRRGQVVLLRLTLPGHNVFEMWAVVESAGGRGFVLRVRDNDETYRKAALYPESVAAKARVQREQRGEAEPTPPQLLLFTEQKADEDDAKMPIRRRLARMGMDDKINLALAGSREERMALAMDSNKAVHHYLLKNAKLTLDEVAYMARLPSLNPDVLDKIAENPAYTQNPSVTKALVFNPRTPVRTAIRLLDRLPRNELVNLSKRMSMNQRLVIAAKNKLFNLK